MNENGNGRKYNIRLEEAFLQISRIHYIIFDIEQKLRICICTVRMSEYISRFRITIIIIIIITILFASVHYLVLR